MNKLHRLILLGLGLVVLAPLALRFYTAARYHSRVHPVDDAPRVRVAIVFGAGLRRDGAPTPVLADRVATAAALYRLGKVEKLLLSGDNRFAGYNEPAAMRQAALDLGVPEDALVLDYAGRSTYDTCFRARDIFGVQRAVLVTQDFHLDRALFICDALGIDAEGVAADRRPYAARSLAYWNVREVLATAAAWWDLNVSHPLPVLGEPLPIH